MRIEIEHCYPNGPILANHQPEAQLRARTKQQRALYAVTVGLTVCWTTGTSLLAFDAYIVNDRTTKEVLV